MNFKEMNLKPGEVALYHVDGTYYKFRSLRDACKRAVETGRSPMNGWNIIDDLGGAYERVDWDYIAQHG